MSVDSSDDSAVGSIISSVTNREQATTSTIINNIQQRQLTTRSQPAPRGRPRLTRPNVKDVAIDPSDLRTNNGGLIASSIRTVFSCFDDLDVQRFTSANDYLINFISNGINKCTYTVLRPMSILWPDSHASMENQLNVLDSFLLNTMFREKPVQWMLDRGLTVTPNCRFCNSKMSVSYENNTVKWQCLKTAACSNYYMPIQRPSFFSSHENLCIDKLLFTLYYWSTCTPCDRVYSLLRIDPESLHCIWKRIQCVCRTALEKSYPRHRLTNLVDQNDRNARPIPIDMISIKLNGVFVVCAKHPLSHLVRLGILIPRVSKYTFVDLTESWFAHGAQIRVAEIKFLELSQRRKDLKVDLVSPVDIVSKDGQFNRVSAFGYLCCQLALVLKDFDSSTLSREDLKLVLAELEWRELYGTTPFDAINNIVKHIAQYSSTSDWYTEIPLPETGETLDGSTNQYMEGSDYVWAEAYFYATIEPVDSAGNIICRFIEPPNLTLPPEADVRLSCHICKIRTECFDFTAHLIEHIEYNRGRLDENRSKNNIQCKHCFRQFKREEIYTHSNLFRTQYHTLRYGCRICCIKLHGRRTYLQHMRRHHFEHETPYRCPSCKFASSFQRDVYIHFQEEHRNSMMVMCTICLRSFAVRQPELMTEERMDIFSKYVYNHISEHYAKGRGFACEHCCLCFLDKDKLIEHVKNHHNPLELDREVGTKLIPFVVTPEEEKFCVRALPMELFTSNKRPNKVVDPSGQPIGKAGEDSDSTWSDSETGDELQETPSRSRSKRIYDSEEASEEDAVEDGFIHVRGLCQAKSLLQGGAADLKVVSNRYAIRQSQAGLTEELTSQKLIDYLSRMPRADGVIPNQSVILTPDKLAAKCCECLHYVTTDHFVAVVACTQCKYTTHCPRALTSHKNLKHSHNE